MSLGPGSKWIDVYKAMDAHNLTVPGARMSDVGVGGFLAGGEMGEQISDSVC